MPTSWIETNDLRISLVDQGQGTPVVLLHGFPDTSSLWSAQVDALAAAGYRALAPDLRGRGASERPSAVAAYALPQIVSDVTGIMDQLGIERAHVVGHDWGAGVAWLLASLAPERVDRLVVISVGFPGAVRPKLETLQKGWYQLLFLFEGAAEELLRRDDWYLMRELLGNYPRLEQALTDLEEPEALTAALNWYRANVRVESLLSSGSRLPAVRAPTLGIFGAGDPYLTERAMLASEERVEGPWRYERLEDVGHWVPLEAPGRLNELLLEFLAPSTR